MTRTTRLRSLRCWLRSLRRRKCRHRGVAQWGGAALQLARVQDKLQPAAREVQGQLCLTEAVAGAGPAQRPRGETQQAPRGLVSKAGAGGGSTFEPVDTVKGAGPAQRPRGEMQQAPRGLGTEALSEEGDVDLF